MMINATIIAFAVLFIHSTSWDGMINDWIKKYIDPDKWYAKPIYGCPICMTPYYGSIIYVAMIRFDYADDNILSALLTLFVAGGINTFMTYFNEVDVNIVEDDYDEFHPSHYE